MDKIEELRKEIKRLRQKKERRDMEISAKYSRLLKELRKQGGSKQEIDKLFKDEEREKKESKKKFNDLIHSKEREIWKLNLEAADPSKLPVFSYDASGVGFWDNKLGRNRALGQIGASYVYRGHDSFFHNSFGLVEEVTGEVLNLEAKVAGASMGQSSKFIDNNPEFLFARLATVFANEYSGAGKDITQYGGNIKASMLGYDNSNFAQMRMNEATYRITAGEVIRKLNSQIGKKAKLGSGMSGLQLEMFNSLNALNRADQILGNKLNAKKKAMLVEFLMRQHMPDYDAYAEYKKTYLKDTPQGYDDKIPSTIRSFEDLALKKDNPFSEENQVKMQNAHDIIRDYRIVNRDRVAGRNNKLIDYFKIFNNEDYQLGSNQKYVNDPKDNIYLPDLNFNKFLSKDGKSLIYNIEMGGKVLYHEEIKIPESEDGEEMQSYPVRKKQYKPKSIFNEKVKDNTLIKEPKFKGFGFNSPQKVNNINSLIENLNINVGNLQESTVEVRSAVKKALLDALRDVEAEQNINVTRSMIA